MAGDGYFLLKPDMFCCLLSQNSCSIFLASPKKSGRQDLNLRPLGPEPSALAKLSYAPVPLQHSMADIVRQTIAEAK